MCETLQCEWAVASRNFGADDIFVVSLIIFYLAFMGYLIYLFYKGD